MGAKLKQGQYKDRFEFESDFKHMINNAKTYNMQGSLAHNDTLALDSYFDKSECSLWLIVTVTHVVCSMGRG